MRRLRDQTRDLAQRVIVRANHRQRERHVLAHRGRRERIGPPHQCDRPVNPADTEPKRGSWFLTEGNIFPPHTIQGDGSTFDPNSPGAIGRWICRGTHLVSLTDILNGAPLWVATQQTYLLPNDRRLITTDGTEGNIPLVRAVTGGTGIFRGYVGEQHQQFLGFNTKNGVNLRVTFVLRRAAN